jgi:hypothetical protein
LKSEEEEKNSERKRGKRIQESKEWGNKCRKSERKIKQTKIKKTAKKLKKKEEETVSKIGL